MSVPDSVIIDDSDPSVIYESGKWVTDTSFLNYTISGRPFNSSAHVTYEEAFFTITFVGTEIELWGLSTTPAKTWVATFDGATVDSTSSSFGSAIESGAEPSFQFSAGYSTEGVDSSPHTLNMTVMATKDSPVAFDFARYFPTELVQFKDITVGVLEYTVSDAFTYMAVPAGWDNSDFLSTSTPDAPYVFNFTGTSIAGLGGNNVNDSHTQAIASYSIDGGTPVNFTVNNLATSILGDITEQTLFQTSQYSLGNHSLTLIYHGNNITTPLTLNSLLVTTTDRSISVDPAPLQSSASSASVSSTSKSSPTSTSSTTPLSHIKSHTRVVAAAIGISIALMVLIAIAGFLLYRRRRRRIQSKRFSTYSVDPGPVATAIVPFADESWAASKHNPEAQASSAGYSAGMSIPSSAGRLPAPRVVTRVHEDSGISHPQPAEQVVVVDVPPLYTSLNVSTRRQNSTRRESYSRKERGFVV